MQFSSKQKKRININITSLIDVLFLLLIFFIVSSTFVEQPGLKLDLPKTSGRQGVEVDGYTLFVTADGKMFINEESIPMTDLENYLKKSVDIINEKGLILKGDEGVRYGIVVEIMDAARNAGVVKLIVATELKESK
ncbi:biopolymer transporter ExbD [bacterium]|nr:biopolymer transporter ExbD [bacterium]